MELYFKKVSFVLLLVLILHHTLSSESISVTDSQKLRWRGREEDVWVYLWPPQVHTCVNVLEHRERREGEGEEREREGGDKEKEIKRHRDRKREGDRERRREKETESRRDRGRDTGTDRKTGRQAQRQRWEGRSSFILNCMLWTRMNRDFFSKCQFAYKNI